MDCAQHSFSAGQIPSGGRRGAVFTLSHLSHLFGHVRDGAEAACFTRKRLDRILFAALESAVIKNDEASALVLIFVGVDFKGALNLAIEHGNNDTAIMLLDQGANPNGCPDFVDSSPLYIAAKKGNREMLVKLLKKGARVDYMDHGADGMAKQEGTALFAATEHGHIHAMQVLLNAGADWSIRSVYGLSPLESASERGDEAVLSALLAAEPDVNATNDDGRTPLHVASTKVAVDLLVGAGANLDARSAGGFTPLMCAIDKFVAHDVARALVHHGAAVNSQDEDGNSSLHYAVELLSEKGNEMFAELTLDLVDCLLRSGADETIVNNNGETAAGRAGGFESNYSRESFDRLYRMLEKAHIERVWRRRGILFLCIFHLEHRPPDAETVDTPEMNSTGLSDSTVNERPDDGWTLSANWWLSLKQGEPGIFRTIVGYL